MFNVREVPVYRDPMLHGLYAEGGPMSPPHHELRILDMEGIRDVRDRPFGARLFFGQRACVTAGSDLSPRWNVNGIMMMGDVDPNLSVRVSGSSWQAKIQECIRCYLNRVPAESGSGGAYACDFNDIEVLSLPELSSIQISSEEEIRRRMWFIGTV